MRMTGGFHMKCKHCGADLPADSNFCTACGKPVGRSGKRVKPILIAAVAVAAAAVIGLAAFLAFRALTAGSSEKYPLLKRLLVVEGETETFIYGGSAKPAVVDGRGGYCQYSMDGGRLAMAADTDEDGLSTLWYCDGKKSAEVASDVYDFTLAPSGDAIIYLTNTDNGTGTGELYLYNAKDGESEKVADDAYAAATFSPDGKTYAYISDVEIDDYGYLKGFTGCFCVDGGDPIELDENQYVIAVGDGGDFVYMIEADPQDAEGTLYVRKGDKEEKLGSIDSGSSFYFNRSLSEILYTRGGSTYLSVGGEGRQKVSDLELSTVIVPDYTQYAYSQAYNEYGIILNIRSFSDKLLCLPDEEDGGTTISYLDKDREIFGIDELDDYYYMYDISLSADGRSLCYLNDSGKMLFFDDFRNLKIIPDKYDADVDIYAIEISPDASAVYFVDVENTMWVKMGSDDPREIADNVDPYSLWAARDGKGLYFLEEKEYDAETGVDTATLCYIENKKGASPEDIADGVSSFELSDHGIVYYVFDHTGDDGSSDICEAFYSRDGRNFDKIMGDAVR